VDHFAAKYLMHLQVAYIYIYIYIIAGPLFHIKIKDLPSNTLDSSRGKASCQFTILPNDIDNYSSHFLIIYIDNY
jgi:hypothetical protein